MQKIAQLNLPINNVSPVRGKSLIRFPWVTASFLIALSSWSLPAQEPVFDDWGTQAQQPEEAPKQSEKNPARFTYRFSSIREQHSNELLDINPDLLLPASDLHFITLELPIGQSFQLDLDYSTELISGAEPLYMRPSGVFNENDIEAEENTPVTVYSGEEDFDDTRHQLSARASLFFEHATFEFNGGLSIEEDYLTVVAGGSLSRDFGSEFTRLILGGNYSRTTIKADTALANSDFQQRFADEGSQTRGKINGFAEISQIFSADYVMRIGSSFSIEQGYLSDPYRLIYVVDNDSTLSDHRPDRRHSVDLYMHNRFFIESIRAAFHLDYRFYFDNWKMTSHEVNLAWYQDLNRFMSGFDFGLFSSWLSPSWQISLNSRYYSQSEAFFYDSYLVTSPSDDYFSSDYRLADFGALSAGMQLDRRFDGWKIYVGFEHYFPSQNLALSVTDELEPSSLLETTHFSLGVEFNF